MNYRRGMRPEERPLSFRMKRIFVNACVWCLIGIIVALTAKVIMSLFM